MRELVLRMFGATILFRPEDIPGVGRSSVLEDPSGTVRKRSSEI